MCVCVSSSKKYDRIIDMLQLFKLKMKKFTRQAVCEIWYIVVQNSGILRTNSRKPPSEGRVQCAFLPGVYLPLTAGPRTKSEPN